MFCYYGSLLCKRTFNGTIEYSFYLPDFGVEVPCDLECFDISSVVKNRIGNIQTSNYPPTSPIMQVRDATVTYLRQHARSYDELIGIKPITL